jgi:hypothetical protein
MSSMRIRTGLIGLIAVSLIAMMPPALAAKGGSPGKPGGGAEHPPGLTCREALGDEAFAATGAFTLDLADGTDAPICIDWSTTTATEWWVTVTGDGLRGAYVNLRDSHPGDFCWRGTLDRGDLRGGTAGLTIEHSSGPRAPSGEWRPIPIAAVDACGTEYTDSAAPYALTVSLKGSGPATIEVVPLP